MTAEFRNFEAEIKKTVDQETGKPLTVITNYPAETPKTIASQNDHY